MNHFAGTFTVLLTLSAQASDDRQKDMREYDSKPAVRSISKDKFSKAPTVPHSPEPPWPNGIIESGLAPFPSGFCKIENQWHEILGGEHVKVYAGVAGDDALQGLVVVQTTSLDLAKVSRPEVYKAPSRDGALRIVSGEKPSLALQSSNGTRYVFDLFNRRLIASTPTP